VRNRTTTALTVQRSFPPRLPVPRPLPSPDSSFFCAWRNFIDKDTLFSSLRAGQVRCQTSLEVPYWCSAQVEADVKKVKTGGLTPPIIISHQVSN